MCYQLMTPHRIDNLNIYIYSNDNRQQRKAKIRSHHFTHMFTYQLSRWINCVYKKKSPINSFPNNKANKNKKK